MSKGYINSLRSYICEERNSEIITGTVLSVEPLKISCYEGQWVVEEEAIQVARHVRLKKRDCCHADCTAEGCSCNIGKCKCPATKPVEVGDEVVLIGREELILIGVLE